MSTATATYTPKYQMLTREVKESYKITAEPLIRKALEKHHIILKPTVAEKVINALAENVLVTDDEQRGLVFSMIAGTEIGILFSQRAFTLQELLNETKADRYIDHEASRLSKLSHRGKLRQDAINMVPLNAKARDKEIERVIDEMEVFELRDLKAGMRKVHQSPREIREEFNKLRVSQGRTKVGASTSVNFLTPADDLGRIQRVMSTIAEQ